MIKRKIGVAFIIGSIVTWLIDRFLGFPISTLLGEIFCGNRYMQPVEGIVGDASCGFNADMYLVIFILAALLTGITLVVTTKSRK